MLDGLGIVGVLLILIAYAGVQAERLDARGLPALGMNLAGSLLILASLVFGTFNLSAALVEGVWALIALYGLARRLGRSEPEQEASEQGYASIDPVIDRWVRSRDLKLVTGPGEASRCWYMSSGSECFQVSIAPPSANSVTVAVRAVETDDDAELSGQWTAAPEILDAVLIAATDLIELWMRRTKSPERRNAT
jgi:hypothetical protein